MNKTVLVTASSRGIGRSVIIDFAKLGYNVVINYVNNKNAAFDLKKLVETTYKVQALVIKADISKEEEIINMIDCIIRKFKKIDVLINNAGIACDNYFLDKTKEEFMRVLEVNLVGTFLVCKYASKYLDGGVIINVSSTDADDTYSEISMDYCASKAGVNSLTKTLSLALPNVRVISIMPPWVKTDSVMEMNPLYLEKELKRVNQKRLLEKEEVSNKILEIVLNRDIKSGSIVKIEGEHIVEYK